MNTTPDTLSDLSRTDLAMLAGAQRRLLCEREARGMPGDLRSMENLKRLEDVLTKVGTR